MAEQQKVHRSAVLERPYESVRDVLRRLPVTHPVTVPGHVDSVTVNGSVAGLPAVTRVTLDWSPGTAPGCHPVSGAELYVWAASPSETRLEVEGHWAADPTGAGGHAAEVCAEALLENIIERVRAEIDAMGAKGRGLRS
jgi:hypothetical protein